MSNLSRRSLVASAAALPALAVPAVALAVTAEPDPIFALIERHRAVFNASSSQISDSEEEELCGQVYEQGCVLAETAPSTLAGVIAIIKYRRELEGEGDEAGYELFSTQGGATDPRDHITAWLTVIEKALGVIASRTVQS